MPSHYGQFCPVAKAMELLDERWTLLVVRELMMGSQHFNALRRGVPRMSPALLSKRLHTLVRAGVVERREDGNGSPTGSPRPARSSSRSSRPLGTVGHPLGGPSWATRTSTRTCWCGTSTATSTPRRSPTGARSSPSCCPTWRPRRGTGGSSSPATAWTCATSTRGTATGHRRGRSAHPHPPVARRRRLGRRCCARESWCCAVRARPAGRCPGGWRSPRSPAPHDRPGTWIRSDRGGSRPAVPRGSIRGVTGGLLLPRPC